MHVYRRVTGRSGSVQAPVRGARESQQDDSKRGDLQQSLLQTHHGKS